MGRLHSFSPYRVEDLRNLTTYRMGNLHSFSPCRVEDLRNLSPCCIEDLHKLSPYRMEGPERITTDDLDEVCRIVQEKREIASRSTEYFRSSSPMFFL